MESLTSSVSDRKDMLTRQVREEASRVSGVRGQRKMLEEQMERYRKEADLHNGHIMNLKLIETYLAAFADERQAMVYRQIENTVTEGLRAVFLEDMRLEVSTKMVGSRPEVVFNIVSVNEEEELRTGIMDARGGGVAAIVGFLIQAVLVLLTPNLRPIIFLDESFRNVSEEYQAPLGEFIKELCERTGLQVVLVTHQPTIAEYADSHYGFTQRNGRTRIEKVV